MDPILTAVLLAVTGVVAGTLNVVAGGGSFLTLPLLIFLGLPPQVANGTNRVGILMQNASALRGFMRANVVDRGALVWAALPATAGASIGIWAALVVTDDAFKRILALLMIIVTLWTLWDPFGKTLANNDPTRALELTGKRRFFVMVAFFLVGIYGGFVQAGVGFFLLAVTTFAGLDLVRGNAIKVLTVLCFTTLALALFAWQGKVAWTYGLALAAGTIIGGRLGAHLTVAKGHKWIRGVVVVTVLVFAVKLWLDS
ncbi:MAG: TSUP family transporter [Acidobacteriota bacterium]